MEIKIYKTNEIPESLWEEIALGFQEAFNTPMTAQRIKSAFCVRNPLGYGYHAVALSDDGELAGYNVFSPTFYHGGLKVVVGGSTFVRQKFRSNEFLFMQMVRALRKQVIADGYDIEVGVPNHNSRRFAEKILGLKYVCDLNYYLLPLRISKCLHKKSLRFLDPLSILFCRLHLCLQGCFSWVSNSKEKEVKYRMQDDKESIEARFKGPYKHFYQGDVEAYYRIVDEDGINTAYLMDFREQGKRTTKALIKSVLYITQSEHPDAILYVGLLRLGQCVLFKVPKRFVPKVLPFTCCVLDKKKADQYKDIWDANNWNFSLMNFDVR